MSEKDELPLFRDGVWASIPIPKNRNQIRRLCQLREQERSFNRLADLGEMLHWPEQNKREFADDDQAHILRNRILRALFERTGATIEKASALLDTWLYDPRVTKAGDPWRTLMDAAEFGYLDQRSPQDEYDALPICKRRWLDVAVRRTRHGIEPKALIDCGISPMCAAYAARLARLEDA